MISRLVALALLTSALHAQTWTLTDGFPLTQNPDGAWAVGSSSAVTVGALPTDFTPFDTVGPYTGGIPIVFDDVVTWQTATSQIPYALENTGEIEELIEQGLTVFPTDVYLHPGPENEHAIARWTAPADGTYEVESLFEMRDDGAFDVDVHVIVAGTEVFGDLLTGPIQPTMSTVLVTLEAGDLVDHTVGLGLTDAVEDATLVEVTIRRVDVWDELIGGLAGASGEPSLHGEGALLGSAEIQLDVRGAAPSAPAWLIVGLVNASKPLKGGVLVPSPDVVFPFLTDPTGAASIPATWPPGVMSGTTFYWQAWIADAGGPAGFAATNALATTVP